MTYTVPSELHGITVREFLYAHAISGRTLRALKEKENGIQRNGETVTVRAVLSAGDMLSLAIEEHAPRTLSDLLPRSLVLYEDEHILVLNKPAGMPTHPSFGHRGDTLSDLVLAAEGKGAVFRAVNRLDRGTSGTVLLARNRFAAAALSRDMAAGRIHKEYLALISHPITPAKGNMQDGIRREGKSIIRREACPVGEGDFAETDYQTLQTAKSGLTLVRLFPKTGRTHQLRVQLAGRGCPIVGDDLYGGAPLLSHQALHAAALSFRHPLGQEMMVKCDLPQDICHILEKELP